jgi:hypothetical protein
MTTLSPFSAHPGSALGAQTPVLFNRNGQPAHFPGGLRPRWHTVRKYVREVSKKLKKIKAQCPILERCVPRLSATQNNPCLICAVQYIAEQASG